MSIKAIGSGSWSGIPAVLTGPEEEKSVRIWIKLHYHVLPRVTWIYLPSLPVGGHCFFAGFPDSLPQAVPLVPHGFSLNGLRLSIYLL